MNSFDIIVAVIVGIGLVRGGFRGFVKEVASIVGVVAGFYGASVYYAAAGDLLMPWIDAATHRELLGFFIIFMLIVLGVGLGATLLRYFMKIALLGWVDRFCGMVFGATKGILVCVVIFILATTFVPGQGKWISSSRFAPYLGEISQWASLFVDNDIKSQFQKKIKRIKALWEKQKMDVKTKA
ncbi:membrane protein required for colicin V production [Desulfocicer vacuolatum DSM 3385]|uniref:Membrane protein required for colicin V production n=1 Tax=Desulfocicer vacuolatum DSM 3385 TaxID=1121400 RepID=A0A1W1YJN3_9BACT|nr:CvpA family protein [Desulfocicer vacuolatum]SMC36389.1 membrane protein required for colicin V production [Desulfocicer vacuolatum DSM 3385]